VLRHAISTSGDSRVIPRCTVHTTHTRTATVWGGPATLMPRVVLLGVPAAGPVAVLTGVVLFQWHHCSLQFGAVFFLFTRQRQCDPTVCANGCEW
jgi:hypothetical protein